MTPQELKTLIRSEIQRRHNAPIIDELELDRCLVEPRKRKSRKVGSGGRSIELWIVLEEDPRNHRGYMIVYDEMRDAFGLAMETARGFFYLREYGSFLDALRAA
jgi:hypothetical protein